MYSGVLKITMVVDRETVDNTALSQFVHKNREKKQKKNRIRVVQQPLQLLQ